MPPSPWDNVWERNAQADENVARHIVGKTLKKAIVVPGKLVNLVVTG